MSNTNEGISLYCVKQSNASSKFALQIIPHTFMSKKISIIRHRLL